MTNGETHYIVGYQAGHAACVRTGTTREGHRWLAANQRADPAYIAGYEWALFDYADANGLPTPLAGTS